MVDLDNGGCGPWRLRTSGAQFIVRMAVVSDIYPNLVRYNVIKSNLAFPVLEHARSELFLEFINYIITMDVDGLLISMFNMDGKQIK